MTNILERFRFFCGFPKFPQIVSFLFFVTKIHFIERVLEPNVSIRKALEILTRLITFCKGNQRVVVTSTMSETTKCAQVTITSIIN